MYTWNPQFKLLFIESCKVINNVNKQFFIS